MTREELEAGGPARAAMFAHAKKGDAIEITLDKDGKPLISNTREPIMEERSEPIPFDPGRTAITAC